MNVMMEKKVKTFGGLYSEGCGTSVPLDHFKAKAYSDERKLLRHYSLRDPATILMNALRSVGIKNFLKGP